MRLHPFLAAALLLPLVAAGAASAAQPDVRSGTTTLRTTNDAGTCAGQPTAVRVHGKACPTFPLHWAAPHNGHVRDLVVVLHGHGHNGEQYDAQLADLARRDGVVAVAPQTDELAPGQPSRRGPFDAVDEEGRDAAAAISWARSRFRTRRTYVFATSMGGSGLAYFLDAATRPTAGDVDATWVQRSRPLPLAGVVDVEGIASLSETWAEATGADPTSAAEIEAEAGGTPATAPDAYRARSTALLTPAQWRATGLPAAAVVHDLDDGLVPYDQTLEVRASMLAGGVPVQSYDVVFKDACTQGSQTTATSYTALAGGPSSDPTLCLAGHANENAPATPNMRVGVQALERLLRGDTSTDERVINPTHP